MPYIKQEDRKKLDTMIGCLGHAIDTDGELNYAITKLCHTFINRKGKCYNTLNSVHGVLNCADKELYRRVTAPYEDKKIEENGDV